MKILLTAALATVTLLSLVQAFLPATMNFSARRRLSISTGHDLSLSLSSTPYDEEEMPFYALGTNLAVQVADLHLRSILEPDELEVFFQAFGDHLRGATKADVNTILSKYGPPLNALLSERTQQYLQRIKQEGADYVQDFLQSHTDATQTDSGLIYSETAAGTGASPTVDSTVTVHYHGTLTDGTVVDSSRDRGEPASFPVNGVIKGWAEGLQLMKQGGKATLVIPSDLAYGDGGSGAVIPPGSTLQFEVELLQVLNDDDMDEIKLEDGTVMQVPKGVKVRMVKQEGDDDKKEGDDK